MEEKDDTQLAAERRDREASRNFMVYYSVDVVNTICNNRRIQ